MAQVWKRNTKDQGMKRVRISSGADWRCQIARSCPGRAAQSGEVFCVDACLRHRGMMDVQQAEPRNEGRIAQRQRAHTRWCAVAAGAKACGHGVVFIGTTLFATGALRLR